MTIKYVLTFSVTVTDLVLGTNQTWYHAAMRVETRDKTMNTSQMFTFPTFINHEKMLRVSKNTTLLSCFDSDTLKGE